MLKFLTGTAGEVTEETVEKTGEFFDKVIEFSDKPWVQAVGFIVGAIVLGALAYQFVIKPLIRKARKL